MIPGFARLRLTFTRRPPARCLLPAVLLAMACAAPAVAAPPLADTLAASAGADSAAAAPLLVSPAARPAPAGGGIGADRLAHASLALAIGVGIGTLSDQPAAGAASAVTLSLVKEILDQRFDRGDFAAGALGAGLAALIVAALRR